MAKTAKPSRSSARQAPEAQGGTAAAATKGTPKGAGKGSPKGESKSAGAAKPATKAPPKAAATAATAAASTATAATKAKQPAKAASKNEAPAKPSGGKAANPAKPVKAATSDSKVKKPSKAAAPEKSTASAKTAKAANSAKPVKAAKAETAAKSPKADKAPKAPKADKSPKAPKADKTPKAPKADKTEKSKKPSSKRGPIDLSTAKSVAAVAAASQADSSGYVVINGRRVRMISTKGLPAPKRPKVVAEKEVEKPEIQVSSIKTKLTKKELDDYRSLLLAKRRQMIGTISGLEDEALRSSGGNLSNMPLHMADIGTDTFDQDFTLGMAQTERQTLGEIDAALQRIENKTYGVCQLTGKPIPKARLEAKPWAKFSIEAAKLVERGMAPR